MQLIKDGTLTNEELSSFLARHLAGDWGDICEEDWALNDEAAAGVGDDAGRVLSSYQTNKHKLWIITEWDRSATTILLPEEY